MEYDPLPGIIEPLSETNYLFLTKKLPLHESAKAKKGKMSDLVLENLLLYENDDNDKDNDTEDDDVGEENDDDYENDDNDEDDGTNDEDDDDDEGEDVNFAAQEFDDVDPKLPSINYNDKFTWIILWILQYQHQYRLSKIAIDSLFKFLRFFLLTIDENNFLSFPSSLYMAKKSLGISTKIIKYAACNKCHKLYKIEEILNKTETPTCSFINYLNHSIERLRQKCNNPLIKKIDSNSNQIFRPMMTFPLVNVKQQLSLFFGRKNFETSCRRWAERKNETEALFDIYDGMIWKSFTGSVEDDNVELFYKRICRFSYRIDVKYGLVSTIYKFTIFCWCNICRYLQFAT
jgi:hypothetical protein